MNIFKTGLYIIGALILSGFVAFFTYAALMLLMGLVGIIFFHCPLTFSRIPPQDLTRACRSDTYEGFLISITCVVFAFCSIKIYGAIRGLKNK